MVRKSRKMSKNPHIPNPFEKLPPIQPLTYAERKKLEIARSIAFADPEFLKQLHGSQSTRQTSLPSSELAPLFDSPRPLSPSLENHALLASPAMDLTQTIATQSQSPSQSPQKLRQQAPERIVKLKTKRNARSLMLMKSANQIYSIETEKRMIEEHNLEHLCRVLGKLSDQPALNLGEFVKAVVTHLKAAFFGCNIDLGICTDSSGSSIDFFGDASLYKRRIDRKHYPNHACFVCIDTRQQVVEPHKKTLVVSKKKASGKHAAMAQGSVVVYVPLAGRSGVQGVLEIAGLVTEGYNPKLAEVAFQREIETLRTLILSKDYR